MDAEAEDLDSILKTGRDFQIGGHKAASFARALKRARIFLVSGIDRNLVRDIFMEPLTMCRRHMTRRQRRWDRGPG